MPETRRITVGRGGILVMLVSVGLLVGLISLRWISTGDQVSPPPPGPSATVFAKPPSDAPTIRPTFTPAVATSSSPIATPTAASPTIPPPAVGQVAPVVLSTAQFERVFESRLFIGTTVLVDGTIDPVEDVASGYVSDGLNCDGELACVYGKLAGASAGGGGQPLLVWSERIATPLGPDDFADEYWWPSRDRQPPPLAGLLVLHIDTGYSVEYVGRALVDLAGTVWSADAVTDMDLSGLPLDQVVLVDGWLGGSSVDQDCPDAYAELLPSANCGKPAWVSGTPDGRPLAMQPDAYAEFAPDPRRADAPDVYEPRHGLMALGRRLMRDGCPTPPCPTWQVLGWVDGDFDTSQIGAIPTPTPVPPAAWIEIPQVGVISARWSPDSHWLLITTPREVELVDGQTGSIVRTYEAVTGMYGRGAVWLDNDRFVVVHQPPAKDKVVDGLVPALLGRVDSERLVDILVPVGYEDGLPFVDMLAGGAGAIAFATSDDHELACGREACWTYRIWTPGGISRQMSGLPVAWSAPGHRLAVIHNDGQIQRGLGMGAGIGDTTGWLEVVKWPALETIYADRHVVMDTDLRFSPVGDMVAASIGGARMVDLVSGRVTNIEQSWWWPPVWDSSGNLMVTTAAGDVRVVAPDGEEVAVIRVIGQRIVGTADGSTQVAYIWDLFRAGRARVLTVIQTGLRFDVALPTLEPDTLGLRPVLAPDGHAVALILGRYTTNTKQLVFSLLGR